MLPEAHGGRLVDRQLTPKERDRREGEHRDLVRLRPHVDQLYDVEKIGVGAYSPLEGFMGPAEIEAVLSTGRLPSGVAWSLPIVLPIPPGARGLDEVRPGDEVGLEDERGRLIALLHVEERFRLDRPAIALGAYGTVDAAHPNVADLLAGGEEALSGPIELVRRLELPAGSLELTPRETRAEFQRRGWRRVAAYQCRNPPHTAHEYLQRLTLEREDVDGLFVHPVVGRLKQGDYRPEVILKAYDTLLRRYYPSDRVLLASLSITMRYAGPKAALFLAIVRKNFGCGLYIVGRDQAGVGRYYPPAACQEIFDRFDLGIEPLRYREAYYCRRCAGMASGKTCAHGPEDRVDTSQTRVRTALSTGGTIPHEILRPEIADLLRAPGVLLE